ncbi:hypothetical protein [Streptomyces sp. NPDC014806]|uniref:hypothetical protein n=1 Tax=Streptomyces sp. NPDC014806 TaxID=3364920 RepID=UPI0036F50877
MSEQPATAAGIAPGLSVRAEEYGENPVADWLCACGHHERAAGPAAVARLASTVVVGHCPHKAEGSAAA